jgi:hypothetical protein
LHRDFKLQIIAINAVESLGHMQLIAVGNHC